VNTTDDQCDGLDGGENWAMELVNYTGSIWIQFIPTIKEQGKQRRKINFWRNIATKIDINNKKIIHQRQKCIAVQTRAEVVK
jgi:tripartite-type tricarboxylate transporter receptor subunit TctC